MAPYLTPYRIATDQLTFFTHLPRVSHETPTRFNTDTLVKDTPFHGQFAVWKR